MEVSVYGLLAVPLDGGTGGDNRRRAIGIDVGRIHVCMATMSEPELLSKSDGESIEVWLCHSSAVYAGNMIRGKGQGESSPPAG